MVKVMSPYFYSSCSSSYLLVLPVNKRLLLISPSLPPPYKPPSKYIEVNAIYYDNFRCKT